ncbi:hypothetical protein F5887DRAFT_1284562 [Amanita rubescens]|nr:hypothetical protein F5887DRAFT_1284562 [Amanita rubescens]
MDVEWSKTGFYGWRINGICRVQSVSTDQISLGVLASPLFTISAYLGYSIDQCSELPSATVTEDISSALEKLGLRVIHVHKGTYTLFIKPLAYGRREEHLPPTESDKRQLRAIAVDDIKSICPSHDVLAEKFLPGREFTVGILGTGEDARRGRTGLEAVARGWDTTNSEHPIKVATQFAKNHFEHVEVKACTAGPMVKLTSHTTLEALKCLDIHFYSNEDGDLPCVLEGFIRPNPSYLPHIAANNGISYEMLVEQIVECFEEEKSDTSSGYADCELCLTRERLM